MTPSATPQMPTFRMFHGHRTASRHKPQDYVLAHRQPGHCAWVAIHPKEGRLYASSSQSDLLALTKKVNANICEILCDYPKRVYFDIDCTDPAQLTLEMVKTVIGKYFPEQRLAVSGSYETAKTSFHITLPDMVITNEDDLERMKQLAKHIAASECQWFDEKVYTKNRVMKCIRQSKNETRAKQEIIECDDEKSHFIGSFLTGAEQPLVIAHEEDIHIESVAKIRLPRNQQGEVVPCVLPQDFSAADLDDARKLLNMCPIGTTTDHAFVWKVANFCYNNGLTFDDFWSWARVKNESVERRNKWLSYHWPRIAKAEFKFTKRAMCAMLSVFYPELADSMSKLDFTTRKFFRSFDLQDTQVIDTITAAHFEVPNKVLAFSMCMGGGKTTQTIEYLKQSKKSFCWITPRQALVMNTEGRLKSEGIDVVNYLTCGSTRALKTKRINEATQLLIQAESLHYIENPSKYDVVVIDEIESVLCGWDSETHKKNIAANWHVFKSLLANSKRVVLLDAFLTTKAFNLFRNLDIDSVLTYKSSKVPTPLRLVSNNSYEETIQKIADDLDAGRKCFVFHAFKSANNKHYSVEQLKSRLLELCKTKPTILTYHGDADDATKKGLYNVNEVWASAHCIITTSAITVGVNYEGKDFHSRYLFLSGMCNNVRDVIQSSMRIRTTSSDAIQVFFFDKCSKDISKLPEFYNETTDQSYRHLIDSVIEERQSDFYESFLRFCQITNYEAGDVLKFSHNEKFVNELFDSRMLMAYEDIPLIDWSQAEDISINRVWQGKASMLDKFALSRYHFNNRFRALTDEQRSFIWNNRFESIINTLTSSPLIAMLEADNGCKINEIDWNNLKVSQQTNEKIDTEFKTSVKNVSQKTIKAINHLCGAQFIICQKASASKHSHRTSYELCEAADSIFEIINELKKPFDFVSDEPDDLDN